MEHLEVTLTAAFYTCLGLIDLYRYKKKGSEETEGTFCVSSHAESVSFETHFSVPFFESRFSFRDNRNAEIFRL